MRESDVFFEGVVHVKNLRFEINVKNVNQSVPPCEGCIVEVEFTACMRA